MQQAARFSTWFTHRLFPLMLSLVVLPLLPASAQVHFSGAQTTVSSNFTQPSRLALDSKGDIFVSDVATNQILEEIPNGNTYQQVVIPTSALAGPYGVAVDPSGNLFVSDTGHNRILRETPTASGYGETVLPTSALNTPHCVFADSAGNIFICDMNNYRVLRETPVGDHYVETVVDNRLWCPSGIAEDAQGNIYIADTNDKLLFKETLSGNSYTESILPVGTLYNPTGVAIDPSGTLYIVNKAVNQVFAETPAGNAYTRSVIVSSNVTNPDAIVRDSSGNLFLVDTGNHRILKQQLPGAEFGAAPVVSSPASNPVVESLVFTADTASTLAVAPVVSRQGTTAPDFTIGKTGTCAAGISYAAGASCTVDVAFAPSLAGSISGAVVLLSASGTVVATGYVHGTGNAPLVSFSPPAEVSVGSGLSHPQALAADASGNLYIADTGNGRILKETYAGGAYTQSVVATSSLQGPLGVAVDGSGNVYVSDTGHNRLLEESITPSANGVPSASGSVESILDPNVLNVPAGVVTDGFGNIYLADSLNNRVLMGVPQGSAYLGETLPFPGLSNVCGVAIDGAGNLYLADAGNNRILKETYSAGTYTQSTIPTGALALPKAVAVDSSGDVFVADTGNGRVLEESLNGSSYSERVVRSGLGSPDALALDGSGNLFITDSANSLVWMESFAAPPALQFASTGVGATSASQLVTVTNIGNAPLEFPTPASGSNPVISAGFAFDPTLSGACPSVSSGHDAGEPLAPGASCTLSISFAPTAFGEQQGDLVLSDTNLNAAGALQAIALSGVGKAATTGLVLTVPASVTYGNPVQVSARVTDDMTDALVAGGSISFADGNGPFGAQSLVAGLATESYLPSATGTFTLTASFTPANDGLLKATAEAVLQVTAAPLNVVANSAARIYGAANPSFTGSITGAVNGDSFTEAFTTPAAVTSPVASYPIVPAATGPRLANYAQNIQNGTLQITPAGMSITANDASRVYGAANPAFSGTVTGLLNGDTVAATYASPATPASPVASYPIVPALSGPALANYTPSLHNGKLTVTPAGLTVAANNTTRTYGAANPAFTGTLSGLVNGDLLTETFSTAATPASPVATYAIVPTASGAALANYNPTIANGTLTISPAALALKANDATRTYGAPNPSFTGAVTGAMNNDTFTETFATPATQASAPGTYAIVPSAAGPDLGNYTQTATNGTLTISPAALALKANDAARTYGAPNPTFTGVVTGAVNNDSFTEMFATSATQASAPGTYAIVPSAAGPNLANYTQTTTGGTLTITPASLRLTAASATRVYGAPNPAFGGTITGAVPGEQFVETFTTGATSLSGPGTYPITPSASGATLGNYTVDAVPGELTVTAAPLQYGAGNATRLYGAPNPAFAGTVTGAANGELFTESFSTSATPQSPVGVYPVVPAIAGATLANYAPTPQNGQLTIAPAPLHVTIANATRTYGSANPQFTGSLSGLVNGDQLSSTYSSAAAAADAPGQYPITAAVAGAALGNYTLLTSPGVLTVTKAPTSTTLAEAADPDAHDGSVVLTAQVTSPAGVPSSGTVRFFDGKVELGEVPLQGGIAALATNSLQLNAANPLVAVYQGTGNLLTSASGIVPVTLETAGFWIKTAPGQATPSVATGASASIGLLVGTDQSGTYPGVVTFSVGGLPAGAAATFSPATLAADAGNQSVTLTVQLPPAAATTASLLRGARGLAMALVLLPLAGARRLRQLGRAWSLTVLLLASFVGAGVLTGCGFTPGDGLHPDVKPVTYPLIISMTSGGVEHTANVTLTVQP